MFSTPGNLAKTAPIKNNLLFFIEKAFFVQVGTYLAISISNGKNPHAQPADSRFAAKGKDAKRTTTAMYRNLKNALALGAFALLGATNAANAQNTYFPNDAIINYAVSGDAEIGLSSSSGALTSPTVAVVPNGSIGGTLNAFNSSYVTVSGGVISSAVQAFGNSHVTVSGGSIGSYVYSEGTATLTVTGGSFGNVVPTNGELQFTGHSSITWSGGSFRGQGFDGINVFDQTTGAVVFIGSNLAVANARPENRFVSFAGPGTDYDLSGTLQDGTNLAGRVLFVQNGATFPTFRTASTPAPSSAIVLMLGAVPLVGVLRRRRK